MRTTISALAVVALACGFWHVAPPANAQALVQVKRSVTSTNGIGVVIGHIEQRDRVITIRTSTRGSLYEVRDKKGKVLARDLTETQLRARMPEIHQFLKTAVGGKAKTKGAFVNAGLRTTPIEPSLSTPPRK